MTLHPFPRTSNDATRPTVLYVEDQEINILLMQAMLAMRPQVRLLIATNGEDGCRLAACEPLNLLLLDLRLPDCHGTDLLLRLREFPSLARVPAVAVTADVATDIDGSGFVELWPKPLHVPNTLSAIDRLLNLPPPQRRVGLGSGAGPLTDADGSASLQLQHSLDWGMAPMTAGWA